ncbi:hypothetical protein PLICRDRAFT_103321 [Plicaturopsis crispa FD-325 SS-3]|nr:hypothetical protein PLICRDRAFT_103321 [Plicaturopsis crispa FD-325 SS-3]
MIPVAPHHSHSFWDKDEGTARARGIYLKAFGGGIFLVIIAIFTVMPIYWGALWKTPEELRGIHAHVVDFDGGAIGQAVVQAFASISGKNTFTWTVVPAGDYPGGPNDLSDAVLNEKIWIGISVNPGASTNLTNALSSSDASYNGSSAVTVYVEEARNENSYSVLLVPIIDGVLKEITKNFTTQFAKQISSRTDLGTILSRAPGIITTPMDYTIDNIRPFDVAVASAIDFVGLIYLLILSVRIKLINTNTRIMASGLERRLTLRSLIMVRLIAPVSAYFFISLFYSLLSLAFQAPFSRELGRAGFFVYWMLSWLAMTALGMAVEAMVTILTVRFIAFFLIIWIISNVSVSFYPIEVLPKIFRYGYAAPFYNVSRAVRSILFQTKNDIGLNFGVIFAWIAISCITIPLFQWYVRRGEVKALRAQQLNEKAAAAT